MTGLGESMSKAGFCRQCGSNVWLTDDGRCLNGHPAADVTGVYEVDEATSQPTVAPLHAATPASARRRKPAIVITVAVLCVLALCGCVLAVVVPLARRGTAVADEWKARVAEDYPGWRMVGFYAQAYTDSGESSVEYSVTMIPPGRDFPLTVIYRSEKGGNPSCQDEIFQSKGWYHERVGSMLDFVQSTYIDAGKSVSSIRSDRHGAVTVNWATKRQVGPVSSGVQSYDELEYDPNTGKWSIAFSPAP